MSSGWLRLLGEPEYSWETREPPATVEDLKTLERFIGRPLPDDYVEFLTATNGGAVSFREAWYLHLWRAQDVPEWSTAYGFIPKNISGAVAIGSDGGGEGIVLDIRPDRPDKQYPVYLINFVSIDWDEAYYVAPDVRSLLLRQRGLFER